MDITSLSFEQLLQYIDHLRSKGLDDSSKELAEARSRLRELLAERKKHLPSSNKLIPTLVAAKTVTLSEVEPAENKYLIAGLALGALVILISVLWKRLAG